MRLFHRAVATTVAGLALAAAGVVGAAPAFATPEDGEGCAGSPDVPATYVCVISVTPENVTPTTTTTNVPVTVPRLCYVAGCTEEKKVNVPVPGVTPRSGVVATLWYKGQYIPIGVGTVDAVGILFDTIDLASETAGDALVIANGYVEYAATTANGAVATALGIAGNAADTVNEEVDDALVTVGTAVTNAQKTINREIEDAREIIDNLPTADELVDAVLELVRERLEPYQDDIERIREELENPQEIIERLLDNPTVRKVLGLVDDLEIPCVDYACMSIE